MTIAADVAKLVMQEKKTKYKALCITRLKHNVDDDIVNNLLLNVRLTVLYCNTICHKCDILHMPYELTSLFRVNF